MSKLALWNEESAGIGLLDLWGSVNGIDFFSLALGLTPPDNQGDPPLDYGATVFSWAATDLRYVRFDMSDCPQPQTTPVYADFGCSIGEVAFKAFAAGTGVVPEPGTVILLGTGLLEIAVFAGRRRKENEAD